MRMSVNKLDPGYSNLGTPAKVYLDGVLQTNAVTADEEMGYILRYVVRDGKLVVNLESGEAEQEEVWGMVVIEVS